jgi:hypothetical protein
VQTGSFEIAAVVTATNVPTLEYLIQCYATRWDAHDFAAWGAVPYKEPDEEAPHYAVGNYRVRPPSDDTQIVVTNLSEESITLYPRLFNDYGNEILPPPPQRTLQYYKQTTTISVNQYLPKSP